jgi:hypothetical protein
MNLRADCRKTLWKTYHFIPFEPHSGPPGWPKFGASAPVASFFACKRRPDGGKSVYQTSFSGPSGRIKARPLGGFCYFWAILSKWLMPKASRLAGHPDSCIIKYQKAIALSKKHNLTDFVGLCI